MTTPTFLTTWTREPWWVVSCYTGVQTAGNPYGLVPAWNDPARAESWLRERFAEAVAAGAKVVLLDRPMGGTGRSHVTGASWLTIPEWRRVILARVVKSFAGHLRVVPFVGTSLVAADRLEGWTTGNNASVLMDPKGACFHDSQVTIAGWGSALVEYIALDHAGARAHGGMLDKAKFYAGADENKFDHQGRFVGKAIPLLGGAPDMDLVERMPWLATHQFIDANGGRRWTFDPKTTRVYVWFNGDARNYGTDRDIERLVDGYCRRGVIPIINHAGGIRVGKRWAGRKGWMERLFGR